MFNSKLKQQITLIKTDLAKTKEDIAMLNGKFNTVNIMLTILLFNLGTTLTLLYFVVNYLINNKH